MIGHINRNCKAIFFFLIDIHHNLTVQLLLNHQAVVIGRVMKVRVEGFCFSPVLSVWSNRMFYTSSNDSNL